MLPCILAHCLDVTICSETLRQIIMQHLIVWLKSPVGPWLWLLTPLFLAALPHFMRAPLWLGLVCSGLWLLRLAAVGRPHLIPSRPLRLVLTLLCVAGVYASYGLLLGPEPGTALLLLLLALKPLETKGYRDQLVIVLLTYLLVLLHFLGSQSLPAAGYMAVVVVLNTAAMLGLVHDQSQGQPGFRLRLAGVLVLQALPVMLLLFVLFPRLPGSLWGLFQKPETATTGLSETMGPGDVSMLLQSSELVFRVAFEEPSPPVDRLYWRALVLWNTDGRTWSAGDPGSGQEQHDLVVPLAEPLRYSLTMESHNQQWIPALEMPVAIPESMLLTPDTRVQLRAPLRQRAQYALGSSLEYRLDRLLPAERRQALNLPATGNQRSRSLAHTWRAGLSDPQTIVDAALDMFRQESFVYTLSPPLLNEESVDDFLFRTRSGYCEHYAATFTFLMRAAGIPARVVLGYQGGDFNPLGEYFVIRQYHAHAWSEVWLPDSGWTRVDPTSVLAPDRIALGAEALIPNIGVPAVLSSREINWAITVWRNMTMGWDAANALWNQWVLDFGIERQKRFLERLGLGASRLERFTYLLLGLIGSCLAAAALYGVLLLGNRPRPHPADRQYIRFCKRLARLGINRKPAEGPLDFARRASALRPDLAVDVMAVSRAYIQARYAQGDKSAAARLKRLVRSFCKDSLPARLPPMLDLTLLHRPNS